MSNELIYRQGKSTEKESLKQLGILSYHQFSQTLPAEDWATMDRFLNNDKMWEKLVNGSAIFVCEDRGEIIGMAYLVPHGNPTAIYPTDWSYVRMVSVHPEYRGKGIAKRLTQMCVDYAKETQEKIVGLHTSEKMEDAQRIYESIGFRRYKEIDPIYGMRYWLYKLEIE
jgi:ribosomal protein S18 acetylase RimI-like enzyme